MSFDFIQFVFSKLVKRISSIHRQFGPDPYRFRTTSLADIPGEEGKVVLEYLHPMQEETHGLDVVTALLRIIVLPTALLNISPFLVGDNPKHLSTRHLDIEERRIRVNHPLESCILYLLLQP